MKQTTPSPATSSKELETFRDGFTANRAVVLKLLDIEARSCSFEVLPDGRIRITPGGRLGPDEIAFLRRYRDEVRRVLQYQPDDSHLFKN